MFENVKKIYNRLTLVETKKRTLIILITIQSIILSLLVLLLSNSIIGNVIIRGEIDYNQVKNSYRIIINMFFAMVSILAPYFLSNSVNSCINNNMIDILLSERIKPYEFVFAIYGRAVFNIFVMLMSATPILCLVFFFSGIAFIRIIKIAFCLFCFILVTTSVCLVVSTKILDKSISKIVSYIVCLLLLTFQCYYLNYFNSFFIIILYIILSVLFALMLISFSYKSIREVN